MRSPILPFSLPISLMISVQDITKIYGDTTAVDHLSFEIPSGQIVGFLGPNGAGKTTTMRIITGHLAANSGTVTIDGIDVAEHPTEAQKHIGYMPESNPLYRDMLVRDFLTLSADLKGISKSERSAAFEFAINAVGIGEMYHRPIGELSKGYRQRTGLAAALLHQPKVLILDEPTEGLDPLQRNEIRSLIKKLSKDHTIMMSTHVMQEVSAVCNRVIIINKGTLVADGSPDELSKNGEKSQIITLDLEGTKIATGLKQLEGISDLKTEKLSSKKTRATITSDGKKALQPQISQLAHEYQWTIWKLEEKRQDLENVFQQLTNS